MMTTAAAAYIAVNASHCLREMNALTMLVDVLDYFATIVNVVISLQLQQSLVHQLRITFQYNNILSLC